ncbi:hypothetical protein B9L21_05795 [Geobacillus uzenensis]|uniref:Uncharacterized protein n=1 Tax=Geobacillus uzenensis TaxID=129339 RepID=A0ABX4DJ94_9BACL|nr:hypothetical protein B9L21_05795 [Geobacillus uzenensis]
MPAPKIPSTVKVVKNKTVDYVFCWQAKRSIEFFPLPRAFSMTEMPYLCWAFLYTSTGVNSYLFKITHNKINGF